MQKVEKKFKELLQNFEFPPGVLQCLRGRPQNVSGCPE